MEKQCIMRRSVVWLSAIIAIGVVLSFWAIDDAIATPAADPRHTIYVITRRRKPCTKIIEIHKRPRKHHTRIVYVAG